MNADAHHPAASAATLDLSRRDLTVDLARVFCVLLVVVIHVLMVGVGVGADGSLSVTQPLTAAPWFVGATWIGQVMPLFFVVGGFASATAWASTQRRGGDAGDYIRGRLLRLGRPAAGIFVFLAAGLGIATLAGVPADLIRTTAVGIGSPLWFLAAYGITQLCVPLMARLHATRPVTTFVGLGGAALAVDLVRHATDVTNVGLLNLVFVWLFVQQLGFVQASGRLERVHPIALVGIAAACFVALVPMTVTGFWSANMLTNLNPPTVPLIVLGIAQLCLLRLFRPALARLMETRAARAVVFVVGSRGMTVYLWHLPLLIIITGALLAVGAPFPAPGSQIWWLTRIPLSIAVIGLAFVMSLVVGRLERAPRPVPEGRVRPSLLAIAVAAVLAIAPSFVVMVDGLSFPLAVTGAVALPAAVWLLGRSRAAGGTRAPGRAGVPAARLRAADRAARRA